MSKFDMNDIEVSSKLKERVKCAIYEGYNEKNNKKKKTFYIRKGVIAASIFIVLGGVTLNSEFVDASVKKIKNTIESFSYNTKPLIISEDYKKVIGETKEDKGIKITLNEFIIDEDIIFLNTNLDSRNRNDYAQGAEPEIYIDGELIDSSAGSTSSYIHNEDGTVDILTAISIKNFNINRSFDVEIKYSEIEVTNRFDIGRNIKGDWEYNFSFDGRELAEKILIKEINKNVSSESNSKVEIEDIRISPTKITIKAKELSEETVSLILVDNEGNEYKDYFVLNGNWYYMMNTEDIDYIKIIPATYSESVGENIPYEEGAITVNLK